MVKNYKLRVIRSKFPPCPPQYIFIWIWAFSTIGNFKKINVFDLLARYWIWSNCWKLHWIFFFRLSWALGYLHNFSRYSNFKTAVTFAPQFFGHFCRGWMGDWSSFFLNYMIGQFDETHKQKNGLQPFFLNQIWKITEALVCF